MPRPIHTYTFGGLLRHFAAQPATTSPPPGLTHRMTSAATATALRAPAARPSRPPARRGCARLVRRAPRRAIVSRVRITPRSRDASPRSSREARRSPPPARAETRRRRLRRRRLRPALGPVRPLVVAPAGVEPGVAAVAGAGVVIAACARRREGERSPPLRPGLLPLPRLPLAASERDARFARHGRERERPGARVPHRAPASVPPRAGVFAPDV